MDSYTEGWEKGVIESVKIGVESALDIIADAYALFTGETIFGEEQNRWLSLAFITIPELIEQGGKLGAKIAPDLAKLIEGMGNLNPKDINFMQSSIKNATGDFTVLGNVEAIKNGTLKVTDLPAIRVWKDADGKIWTLDHRRLATFKLLGVDNIPVEWVTDDVVQSQMWKMTTKTDGASIKLKLGDGNSIIVE